MKRMLAWAGILLILAAFVALLYLAVTGAPANTILAVLFLMLVIPVILYGMMVVMRLLESKEKDEE